MNTVAIICARSTSSRFPGKHFTPINGKPMLLHTIERTRRAQLVNDVVVACPTDDEAMKDFCFANRIMWGDGPEEDILGRLFQVAKEVDADYVARVWGDCPCIDPEIVGGTVSMLYGFRESADYVASYNHPIGQTVAVMPMEVLAYAHIHVTDPEDRHWIHSYFMEKTNNFRLLKYNTMRGENKFRLCVDKPGDIPAVEAWLKLNP